MLTAHDDDMEAPLLSGGGTLSPTTFPSSADQHTVQLSRYDGRLLLDRAGVPADDSFADSVEADRRRSSKRFNNHLLAVVYCLLVTVYAATLASLGWQYMWRGHQLQFSITASAQSGVLMLALLLELLLKHVHRRHRANGYLQIYRSTKGLVRYPFRIAAVATVAIMLATLWPDHPRWLFGHWFLLAAIAGLQAAAVAVWAFVYSAAVWRHNNGQGWPDAETDLQHGWSAWDHMERRGDKGSAQQAELIRYLHRQRDSLSQEVLRLHVLANRRGFGPSAEAEAEAETQSRDVEAARLAEARALAAAEMLRRENRNTWQMLDERQTDIARLEEQNKQQIDENARLRSTLQEWSTANRKLEQKYEQMRRHLREAQRSVQQN